MIPEAVSSRFAILSRFDEAVNESLNEIGEFCNTDRVYVVLIGNDGKTVQNIYKMQADKVKRKLQCLRQTSYRIGRQLLLLQVEFCRPFILSIFYSRRGSNNATLQKCSVGDR